MIYLLIRHSKDSVYKDRFALFSCESRPINYQRMCEIAGLEWNEEEHWIRVEPIDGTIYKIKEDASDDIFMH
jgi:hypothetical protein